VPATIGANLALQPLASNGGLTQTIALGSTSAALDKGSNPAGLNTDQRGTGFARVSGAAADIGAFELQTTSGTPPKMGATPVVINGGSASRSMVTTLSVAFSTVVTLPANIASAFTLVRTGGGAVTIGSATAATVSGATVVTLTGFVGADANAGSLLDGKYTLTALASQITANGQQLDGNGDGTGGDNFVLADSGNPGGLYRFYGDVNGDRFVNGADFGPFRAAFGSSTLDPNFNPQFDVNGDGFITGPDFSAFRVNFGQSI
jgi:hypothetical protein